MSKNRPTITRGQIWENNNSTVFVTRVWREDYYGKTTWHVAYMCLYGDWLYRNSAELDRFVEELSPVTDKDEIFKRLNMLSGRLKFRKFGWFLRSKALPLTESERGIILLSHPDA